MRKGGGLRDQALKKIFLNQTKRLGVLRYLTSKGCSKQDSEDLYHDAIVIFNRKVMSNEFLSIKSIHSYIFNIAKLNWYNKYRHNRRRTEEDIDDQDKIDEDVSTYYDRQERAEMLSKILGSFGERCKKMLLMQSQGYELTEIAKTLDMVDAERVRKEKYRCLNRMRKSVLQDKNFATYIKTHLSPD